MLTNDHIKKIINDCREIGDEGLNNGIHASIPDLSVDIVTPPVDFLGVSGNPAIFINQSTYRLLGSQHRNWVVNRTIALKASFLSQSPIQIIGAIVHETGHAFNVAAKIENTEPNAYIFEIEAMLHLLKTNHLLPFRCTILDVQSYFKTRLPYYVQGATSNKYLATLVEKIKSPSEPIPESKPVPVPVPVPVPEKSLLFKLSPILPTFFINTQVTLFSHRVPKGYGCKERPLPEYEEFTPTNKSETAPIIESKH